MTVQSDPSPRQSINQLCLLALKRAGVVPIETRLTSANLVAKLEHCRDTLSLILDGLATEGFVARTEGFHDLPLVAGEPYYTLPDGLLDVYGDAMFVPDDNPDTKHTTGELVCKQVDLMTWSTLTVKGAISTRPQLYTAFRNGASVSVRFWPVPQDAGVMRLHVVRLSGGAHDGNASPDLERFWYDCLVWQLAYYLAVDSSMPTEKVALLQAVAESKKGLCTGFSFEHTSAATASVSYPSQWSA